MIEPGQLYRRADGVEPLHQPIMVIALTGFVDAGAATKLAADHLLAVGRPAVAAHFDVDLLLDYRARRPPMLFVEDHWEAYENPTLTLHLVHDRAGRGFLLLAGPEPDVMWERFVAAVAELAEHFGVRCTVGLNAIPMAVPHTRPVGLTVHANRRELLAGHEPWLQRIQVPGSAAHLLEFRRGQAGRDAMGVAVHVPHYLAQTPYPPAAERLLASVARAGDLDLDVEALHEASEQVRRDVDAQVAQAEELTTLVTALENQYDAYVRGRTASGLLATGNGPLPTAEELGAELERFLAEQAEGGEPAG